MSNKPERRRLTTEQRRHELIKAAAHLFGTRPYDDVSIDEIAEAAGASRALLYHYFASKQQLVRAVVEHESTALRAAIQGQELSSALAAYLDYVESHPHGYRLLHQGALGFDGEIRAMITESREHIERIVLDRLHSSGAGVETRLAIRGWIGFAITVCLDWINDSSIDRQTVESVLMRSLDQLTPTD